jgi:thymidine kinase
MTNSLPDSSTRTGTLHVVCGCMFAGKTEELISRVHSEPVDQIAVFKHCMDDRYHDTRVVSHGHQSCDAVPVATAAELLKRVRPGLTFVGIDEGHFFDDAFPDVCDRLRKRGMDVLVTTLDNDSWGQPFPMIQRLRALADAVTVKMTRCGRCDGRANRTQRLTPFIEGKIVGGPEAFEPRCESCWTPPPIDGDDLDPKLETKTA